MKYGISFLMVALFLLVFAFQRGGWFIGLMYPALSFAIVAVGYLGIGPRVFGKRSNGTRSWLAVALLLPYLLFSLATWHLIRLWSREPAINQLDPDLYLSRRLLGSELPDAVGSVVDLTCELVDPPFTSTKYLCFPILDASSPNAEELCGLATRVLELPKPTLIHCAQGHGRTGLVAAAVLLMSGKASTSNDAITMVKAVRPRVELNDVQRRTLDLLKSPG